MKIGAILFIAVCCLKIVSAEYNRYKLRGPPAPPRPPPVPQYAKKRIHPPSRGPPPIRSRPIPVHMPPAYKIPMGVPQGPRPVAPPVRNFWKNTQTKIGNFREKKPFVSSPTVNNVQEFDYQLQTNNIPVSPIKQVGEKGPIHTIPAPNLSLADKPIVVEEVRPEKQQQQLQAVYHQNRLPDFQFHQYQVTESNEANNALFAGQNYFSDLQGLQAQTSVHKAEVAAMANSQLPQKQHFTVEPQLQPNEVYQYLNLFPQQQFADLQQQQQLLPNYQGLLNEQIEPQQSVQLAEVQPEYHSFNYEEQQQKSHSSSSLVANDYNIEPAAESSEVVHTAVARHPNDALAQTQYVQQFFNTKENEENDVEPDAKPKESDRSDIISSAFYATLPNKQAAEALASLQAAGKLNSSSKTRNNQQGIYVTEVREGSHQEKNDEENNEKEEEENKEYLQESDADNDEDRVTEDVTFGSRIKKTKRT